MMKMNEVEQNNLLIYKNEDGNIIVDAIFRDETLWLTQKGMAKVFDVDRSVVTKHLKNIFNEEELKKEAVCAKIAHTAEDGKKYQTDVLDTKGILRLIESVPSVKAEPFELWLASLSSERIDEVFNPEITITRTVLYYKNQMEIV